MGGYYRDGLGFVQDSETSIEAADSFTDEQLTHLNATVNNDIVACGNHGSTSDESEVRLGLRHQTCSSRYVWLEDHGHIVKTIAKRPTRSKRNAFVYVAKQFAKAVAA